MTAVRYRDEIVIPMILPTVQQHNLTLQQDNARPHAARVVTETMHAHNIPIFPWPSRSPDLSPIEHLWDELGRRIYQTEAPLPTSLSSLKIRLQEEFAAIPQDTICKLIRSVPNRLQECHQRSGGHTRY